MRVKLKGVHKVRWKRADGVVVEYHRCGRGKGAPTFWRSDGHVELGSAEYVAAYHAAAKTPPKARSERKFQDIADDFLSSQAFLGRADRTRADIKVSLTHERNGILKKFGAAPTQALTDPRLRKQVIKWRDGIGGKVGDDRVRHFVRILNWARDDTAEIDKHHLSGIPSEYKANRASVIWTEVEIAAFLEVAPEYVGRILRLAVATGFRPGDLVRVGREHLMPTPHGQRLVVPTSKSRGKRAASVPVTGDLAEMLSTLPASGPFLTTQAGEPWSHGNYLGDVVSKWRDRINAKADANDQPEPLRKDLRLYDARGTAATRLMNAGADLREIAAHMGWSFKHASDVVDRYIALHPDMTDRLAEKLNRAKV